MRSLWGAAFVLGMAAAAVADDEALPVSLSDDAKARRLEQLEARLAVLEAQQNDEEAIKKLKEQAAKESQDEMKDLPRRVSSLEKSMSSAGQTWDASKMLSFSTPDGNFTAKVSGRIYVDYRHIFNRNDNTAAADSGAPDTLWVDTARIMLEGSFYKDFYYRLELEAKTGEAANSGTGTNNSLAASARMKDVYIGYTMSPALGFRMGQMKVPFSAEETCSSRWIDFAERSIINRWMPAHDTGFMFVGTLFEKVLDYNLGVFNGAFARDERRGTLDVQDEKMAAGRLYVTPFTNSSMNVLKVLRVGLDFTFGGDADGIAQADITDGDLGGVLLHDFGAGAIDEHKTRLGFNLAWVYGPVSVRAEYATITQELPAANAESDYDVTLYLLQATWLITGEAKVLDNRIKPNNNFSPLTGGWGAFELAVRMAHSEVGDEAVTAGIIGAAENLEADEITIGLNWWWSPNVVWRFNYEMISLDTATIFEAGTATPTDEQDIFILRFQIDF